ncbi:MAG: hypothetical protein H6555_04220 [Lewinellaceae bacterium]|nr:hypothetical protein [Lewinellaceae bacterium]
MTPVVSSDPISIHQEHQVWLSQLDFYQDEVKIFQNELAQVVRKNLTGLSVLEHVNEYRRILLKKLEAIDGFRQQISLHEKALWESNTPLEVEQDHGRIKNSLGDFVSEFEGFKKLFRRFVSRND